MHQILNTEVKTAEDHIWFYSCHPRTGIWAYSVHKLTKSGKDYIFPIFICPVSIYIKQHSVYFTTSPEYSYRHRMHHLLMIVKPSFGSPQRKTCMNGRVDHIPHTNLTPNTKVIHFLLPRGNKWHSIFIHNLQRYNWAMAFLWYIMHGLLHE